MTKTIFITAWDYIIARYILRTGFLQHLLGQGARVVILVPQKRKELYKKEFGDVAVIVELPRLSHSFASRLFLFGSHIGLDISTNTVLRMRAYYGGERGITITRIKGFLAHCIHNSRIFKKILRFLERFIAPHQELIRIFDEYRPQLVFCTALMEDLFDVPVLREAKRRGILTVAMARNWDNLVTFGLALLLPDWFIAQNQFLRDTAIKFQAMPEEKISVIGFPHFDWYLKKELLQTREVFCQNLGIDPSKKIILYGAHGDFMNSHEEDVAETFENLMQAGKICTPAVMVFRAHPSFISPLEKIKAMRHVVPDATRGGKMFSVGDPKIDFEDMRHLINSLYHSDVVVAVSSIALEAVIFDKPTISVVLEHPGANYWFSAYRFHDSFYHWTEMMKCGGIRTADSSEKFVDAINIYLKNPRLDAEGRACVRNRFVGPCDGKATERLAQLLLALARGEKL